MTENKGNGFYKTYATVFTYFTLITGLLAVVLPFAGGYATFFEYAQGLAPIVWVWLLCGSVHALFFLLGMRPNSAEKRMLALAKSARPDDGECVPKARIYQRLRNLLRVVLWLLLIAIAGIFGYYLSSAYAPRFQMDFFTANGGAMDRFLKLLPWLFCMCIFIVSACLFDDVLCVKQAEALRTFTPKPITERIEAALAKYVKKRKREPVEWVIARVTYAENVREAHYRYACEKTRRKRARMEKCSALTDKYAKVCFWIVHILFSVYAVLVTVITFL